MKALAVKALVIHARDRVVELHRRIRGGARSNAPAARTTVLPEAVEFQDGVDEVIKEPFPRFLDSSHYFVVLLFLILVLIAAVIETDVVLTGGGRLITDTPTFVVQTLERGIIRELNIKPGLAVTKGQVLATMDPTFARAQVASTAEGLAKASRIHDLVVLTAPADGVILDVAKLSVGSVLRDAETLATIVPANATLIAEIMIGSDDIGYVKVGETVSIKMDAFAYLRHGLLTGRLISVSAESFSASGPGGEPPPTPHASSGGGVYYRGWVELVNTKLEHMPASAKLLPGMTLTAEIRIGKRTILSYLLSPIIKGLSDSFKEP